jgi:hypothetical protein
MEEVNIDPRRWVGESCLWTIHPQDQVKVNKPSALVLRHLEVADFEHLAKSRHREISIRRETVTGLFNCPIPQARRMRIPDDCALVIKTRTTEGRSEDGTAVVVA